MREFRSLTATKKLPVRIERLVSDERPTLASVNVTSATANEANSFDDMMTALTGLVPEGGVILLASKNENQRPYCVTAKGLMKELKLERGYVTNAFATLLRPLSGARARSASSTILISEVDEAKCADLGLPNGSNGSLAVISLGISSERGMQEHVVLYQSAPFHAAQISAAQAVAKLVGNPESTHRLSVAREKA